MNQRACWTDREAVHILKPDAEEIADHVFRIVHCPSDLHIADTADGNRVLESPEEFVQRFLNPNHSYVQAVVLGESGTGKSHLIQWLRLRIPTDEKTVILTIPKTGTSLRGIVERLIERLPSAERTTFEERLRGVGSYSTSKEAKVSKLLESLAWVIEHGGIASVEDTDLSTLLPDVLRDPSLRREFFLRPGNTAEAIVEHIFIAPDDREGNENRREFSLGDLPLDGVKYNNASSHARDAIDYILLESGMNKRAIDLMNLCLDAAITQTLNFSADNLIELMNTLRRHLEGQGKRLILLIEDFARLQGIDTALLQALITPPGQGTDRLCEIRWAMAVTTGYFDRLEQTVRSRSTFVVDMDISRPTSLAKWTSGYLNALRLGDKRLREISPFDIIPSHCDQCDKKASCTSAFGEVDGVGLFPFTESAINVMATRSESLSNNKFNPREFLKVVLVNVLVNSHNDLENGDFPSEKLLQRIGGKNQLRPIDLQTLEYSDRTNFLRRKALLELWSGTGKIGNFNKGIHDAFGIPMLYDVSSPVIEIPETPSVVPTININNVPPEVEKLRSWAMNGEILPQALVLDLRALVFEALDSFIDWDDLGFKKTMVAKIGGPRSIPFNKGSINFTNQQTQAFASSVSLEISPISALAIEALLLHKHHCGWNFLGGGTMFANLLEALRLWTASICEQLRRLYIGNEKWSPAVACAELLLIATFQSGKVKIGDAQLEVVVSKMWESATPKPLQLLSSRFEKLNSRLVAEWSKLIVLLRNISSGPKGGQIGNFIRISPILKAVRSLRMSSLVLSQSPPDPDGLPTELKELADIYTRTKNEFQNCLAEEKGEWMKWTSEIEEYIPHQTMIVPLLEAMNVLVVNAVDSGINVAGTRGKLESLINEISGPQLERSLAHALALSQSNNSDSLMRLAMIGDAKKQIDDLIELSDKFLSQASAAVENERSNFLQKTGAGLQESEKCIEGALRDLAELFDALQLQGGKL